MELDKDMSGRLSTIPERHTHTRERNQVHAQFAEVPVQLSGETQARADTAHHFSDKLGLVSDIASTRQRKATHMIEMLELGMRDLHVSLTDIVQRLIVDREREIGVLNELVDGEHRVVRLDDSLRDLGRREDGVRRHHPIGELFPELRQQQTAQPSSRSASKRLEKLEPLKRVAALGLLADNLENRVDELCTFGIVYIASSVLCSMFPFDDVSRTSFCPVVSGTTFRVEIRVWAEQASELSTLQLKDCWYSGLAGGGDMTHLVANTGLQIDLHTTRHILVRAGAFDFVKENANLSLNLIGQLLGMKYCVFDERVGVAVDRNLGRAKWVASAYRPCGEGPSSATHPIFVKAMLSQEHVPEGLSNLHSSSRITRSISIAQQPTSADRHFTYLVPCLAGLFPYTMSVTARDACSNVVLA